MMIYICIELLNSSCSMDMDSLAEVLIGFNFDNSISSFIVSVSEKKIRTRFSLRMLPKSKVIVEEH